MSGPEVKEKRRHEVTVNAEPDATSKVTVTVNVDNKENTKSASLKTQDFETIEQQPQQQQQQQQQNEDNLKDKAKQKVHDTYEQGKEKISDIKLKMQKSINMNNLLKHARYSLYDFMNSKLGIEKQIPIELLSNAYGLIFLTELKGGMGVGASIGLGIIIVRKVNGKGWTGPCAIGMGGTSIGFQIGMEKVEHIFILRDKETLKPIVNNNQYKLGTDAAFAVGPLGRDANISLSINDKGYAAIYSYSMAKGVYVGSSLEGQVIMVRDDCNEEYYGKKVSAKDILYGKIEPSSNDTEYSSVFQLMEEYVNKKGQLSQESFSNEDKRKEEEFWRNFENSGSNKSEYRQGQETKKAEKTEKTDKPDTKIREDEKLKRDEEYKSKKDEEYKPRKDEEYKPRKDEEYKPRKDEEHKPRKNEEYTLKKDEEYKPRKDEEHIFRKDEEYKPRKDEEYKPKIDDDFTQQSKKSKISETYNKGKERAQEIFESGKERAQEIFGSGKERVQQIYESGKGRAQEMYYSGREKVKNRFSMDRLLRHSRFTLENFMNPTLNVEKQIPVKLLKNTCALIFLTELKGGFGVGGSIGEGFIISRTLNENEWSQPCAIGMGGASFGFQMGMQKTDHIFAIHDEKVLKTFLSQGQLKLGGDFSFSLGPLGRDINIALNVGELGYAPIYSYSMSRGMYFGATMESQLLIIRDDCNEEYFGQKVTASDILSGKLNPPSMNQTSPYYILINLLKEYVENQGEIKNISSFWNEEDRKEDYKDWFSNDETSKIKSEDDELEERINMRRLLTYGSQSLENFSNPNLSIEKQIPIRILRDAYAIIFLTELKAGFFVGASLGTGIIIARKLNQGKRDWTGPCAIALGGMSVGFQVGMQKTEHIIVLRNENVLKTFTAKGELKIGGDASFSIGPLGRDVNVGLNISDKGYSAIYSYSMSKGAYIGASLEGQLITIRSDCNEEYYGRKVSASEILFGHVQPPKDHEYFSLCQILNKSISFKQSQVEDYSKSTNVVDTSNTVRFITDIHKEEIHFKDTNK